MLLATPQPPTVVGWAVGLPGLLGYASSQRGPGQGEAGTLILQTSDATRWQAEPPMPAMGLPSLGPAISHCQQHPPPTRPALQAAQYGVCRYHVSPFPGEDTT